MNRPILTRLRLINASIFMVFIALVIGCAAAPQPEKKIEAKKPIVERGERKEIKIGKKRRRFYTFTPDSYSGNKPVPLVFDFNGSGGNPKGEVRYSDFANMAESKGFILVALDGIYPGKSWNTTKDPKGVDDIAFIKEVLSIMTHKFNIDKKRIYALGFSGGTRMSSRIGCDMTEIFAAIAPVAGVQFLDDCIPSRSMPVVTFHGKNDLVNHYVHKANSRPYWVHGVEYSVGKWVEANGCGSDPQTEQVSEVVAKLTYSGCRDGAEVIFYRIEDGGHTWPGSPIVMTYNWAGKTNQDIVASDLIWEFFMSHPLP